jgi:hypothetical protein
MISNPNGCRQPSLGLHERDSLVAQTLRVVVIHATGKTHRKKKKKVRSETPPPMNGGNGWLPRGKTSCHAAAVGLYLDPHDLRVCTTQLCSSGAGFVANLVTNVTTTIPVHELVACCRLREDVAQECVERIESFVKRRGNVQTIIQDAQMRGEHATRASLLSKCHIHLQLNSSFQSSQNQGITVEWHASGMRVQDPSHKSSFC